MSIQGVSFYQQDQSFWSKAHAQSQATSASNALINVMGQAEVNLAKGMASIANGQALTRTDNQITALVQQLLQPSGSSSGSSSTATTSSASGSATTGSSAASTGSAATGTGTTVLTTSTSLSTLGLLPGGTITVGTGLNTTTYTSTGTDTVADLINAINVDLPTNANVTASLSPKGQLVITARDMKSAIFVGGSGNDAASIGFGLHNNTFLAKAPTKTPSTSASTSSNSSSTAQGTQTTSATKTALPSYLALTQQGVTSAAGILGASGVSGTLVDLLS
jgi:hypothetical protein